MLLFYTLFVVYQKQTSILGWKKDDRNIRLQFVDDQMKYEFGLRAEFKMRPKQIRDVS
jgi:hypothetical protein